MPVRTHDPLGSVAVCKSRGGNGCSPGAWRIVIGSFIAILSSAIAELRAVSEDIVCCFLNASAFGAVELTGLELGRAVRCCRRGDLSGIGGGGVEGGGDNRPVSAGELDSIGGLGMGGLGNGGGLGLPAYTVVDGIMGNAPGTDGGAWNRSGVARLALALRNELPANDSSVRVRGKDSDIAADSCELRTISPEGLAGRFGGVGLSLRSEDEASTIDSTKLPASLLRLGGPGGGGGGGNSVAGKLILLPPSCRVDGLLFLLPSLGFLNFHVSLSVSRISSTPPPLLLLKRPAFFTFTGD